MFLNGEWICWGGCNYNEASVLSILSNYGWNVFASENCWWVGCLSVTRELALDCEMVGVGYEGKKDALARVSLVHTTLQQLFVINL